MMIKPGISELSKCVDSRYTLVTMAAKRARMIGKERQKDNTVFGLDKPVTVAADEIIGGTVGYVRSGAIERAKAWADEKAAAIMQLSSNGDESESGIEVLDYEDIAAEEQDAEPQAEADAGADEAAEEE